MKSISKATASNSLSGTRTEEYFLSRLERLQDEKRQRRVRIHPRPSAGSPVIDLSSNDYLGLSHHSQLIAAMRAVDRTGSGGARLISGTDEDYQLLESELAAFQGYEAALVFGAGYLANLGSLSALVGKGDQVFADRQVHASMVDGIALSRAKLHRFRHNDPGHLEDLLRRQQERRKGTERFLIAAESVYSMDGDLAPLDELMELAERFDALLYVDEAHALGVFGRNGEGRVAARNAQRRVDFCISTLSKAFAGYGGVVCASEVRVRYLVNTARSFIYNTALPPSAVQTARAALRVLREEPGLGGVVLRRAAFLRSALQRLGISCDNSASHIIPVVVGESERALLLAERLRAQGVLTVAIRPPTVPPGAARLRLSITLEHTEDQLTRAAELIAGELGRLES